MITNEIEYAAVFAKMSALEKVIGGTLRRSGKSVPISYFDRFTEIKLDLLRFRQVPIPIIDEAGYVKALQEVIKADSYLARLKIWRDKINLTTGREDMTIWLEAKISHLMAARSDYARSLKTIDQVAA
jgi:hypothetical protein